MIMGSVISNLWSLSICLKHPRACGEFLFCTYCRLGIMSRGLVIAFGMLGGLGLGFWAQGHMLDWHRNDVRIRIEAGVQRQLRELTGQVTGQGDRNSSADS